MYQGLGRDYQHHGEEQQCPLVPLGDLDQVRQVVAMQFALLYPDPLACQFSRLYSKNK